MNLDDPLAMYSNVCSMCGVGLTSNAEFCAGCKAEITRDPRPAVAATDPAQELLNQIRLRDERIEDLEKTVLFLAQKLREAAHD